MNGDAPTRMDRRTAVKLITAAAASPALLGSCGPVDSTRTAPQGTGDTLPAGTPSDPDLIAPTVPWEGTLTEDELATLASLCDTIIPADDRSPSASAVGAHEFIDEWVSAPYESMRKDRVLVRGGIVWLDAESNRRFGARFREVTDPDRAAICDDICYAAEAAPEYQAASRFFDKVRDLTATAFYTTRTGMDDLGYVGNVPLDHWEPPPPAVLRQVGLG
jgi:hypothetical protein